MKTLFAPELRALLEGAADDAQRRAVADHVYEELLRYVKRWEQNLDRVQLGATPDKSGFMVQGPQGGLPRGLTVVFMPPHGGDTKASYSKNAQIGHMIVLYGVLQAPDDAYDLADEMRMPTIRRSFVHEFIHYQDQLRHKRPERFGAKSKRSKRTGDTHLYFQNAAEFNAYFQEIAHIAETWVLERLEKGTAPGASDTKRRYVTKRLGEIFAHYRAFRKWVTKDFMATATHVADFDYYYKGTKWARKFERRLAGLFDHLKGQVEAKLG